METLASHETDEPEVIEGADIPELAEPEEEEEPLYINQRPIFRVLRKLEYSGSKTGYLERGALGRLEKCGYVKISKLKEKGIITEAQLPPLDQLPHFGARAKRLKKVGIESVANLLGVEDDDVAAERLGIKEEVFLKWKDEAHSWLLASSPKKKKG